MEAEDFSGCQMFEECVFCVFLLSLGAGCGCLCLPRVSPNRNSA